MKSAMRMRARARSLTTVVPPQASEDYSPEMAGVAASVLYKSPIPTKTGHSIYILNAAALPDTSEVDYDTLLPYLLARLPGEDDLINGKEYEVIFFAGSGAETTTVTKKARPGWGWLIQAYHILSRAMRKRIKKLYIVHERTWVRLVAEMFSTVVSPKFRRKIVHASSLTALAHHIPIEDLLIPLSAYLQDRKISPDIHAPYCSGRRAFSANHAFPKAYDGSSRLPRVLREATTFILMNENIRTEGIFRISAPAKVREILKEAYDRGQKFIIWKDHGETLPFPQYPQADEAKEVLHEIDQSETYGVHAAAGIIKLWYSELKDPLVPQTSYRDLHRFFGSGEPEIEQLIDLLSPHSDWSCFPAISREILTRHLLPMLSEIIKYQDDNKMTSENLAVCFAPTFLCGPDQMEDIKISNILRRILAKAVDAWPKLREVFAIEEKSFWNDLNPPQKIDDYEDPLYERSVTPDEPPAPLGPADLDSQRSGIVMKDNVLYDSDHSDGIVDSIPSTPPLGPPPPLPPRSNPVDSTSATPVFPARTRATAPPLPPRPPTSDPAAGGKTAKSATADSGMLASGNNQVRRKPAPPLAVPPRYSVVVGSSGNGGSSSGGAGDGLGVGVGSNELSDSPSSYTAGPVDGFGPPRSSGWSIHAADSTGNSPVSPSVATMGSGSSFRRKPVGSGDEGKGGSLKE